MAPEFDQAIALHRSEARAMNRDGTAAINAGSWCQRLDPRASALWFIHTATVAFAAHSGSSDKVPTCAAIGIVMRAVATNA